MTERQHLSVRCTLVLGLLISLFGCAPTRTQQQFGMALLPAAPRPVVVTAPEPAPEPPLLYSQSKPHIISAFTPVVPPPDPVLTGIARAEERFQTGKRLYLRGDIDNARREFDRAVDLLLITARSASDRQQLDRKMDDLISAIYRLDVEGMGSGERPDQPGFEKAPLEDFLTLTFPVDPKLSSKVKDEVQATISQLPLQVNDAVLGYINFFSSEKGRRTLLAGMRRAGKYRPMIQRILAEEGVPQELIYLAQAESGFLPRAVSRAAAGGMWQFVVDRGREYGLRQSAYYDERMDPEKATRAAARHLKDLYNQFGDWQLAIAAYNCGPGCVDRAVTRTGYADYWELRSRNAVPRETTAYVPIILALTIMAKNAKDYGIEAVESDPELRYDTLEVNANTHLALLADLTERPVAELRELNPSLSGNLVPAGYQVRVPAGSLAAVVAGLNSVPAERRGSWRMHRVNAGDTLASIAKQYNAAPNAILTANAKQSEAIEAGDFLMIPAVSTERVVKTAASRRTSTMPRARGQQTNTAAQSANAGRGSSRPAFYHGRGVVTTAGVRRGR